MLFLALGILLVTVLVLYFGFFKSSAVPVEEIQNLGPNAPVKKPAGISEQKLNQINLDFDFLNNKILSILKVHGKIPVEVDKEKIGRDNPFIPY